ncbi:MAG: cytochrome c biogenesis protein CcdA [Bacteroides sp.]|jgi:thiol:disulfide interchange protein DsbD|nr:cytochrome c biogenesis protein CcdA [Bacteroides sp.]
MKFRSKFSSLFLLFILLMVGNTVTGQIFEPVSWTFSHEKIAENQYELRFTAKIDSGWSIYGTDIDAGGPIPTSIDFKEGNGYTKVGGLRFPAPKEKYDPNFDMELTMFSGSVTFRQTVEVTSTQAVKITGELGFMSCNDSSCLPPDYIEFSFDLPGETTAAATVAETTPEEPTEEMPVQDTVAVTEIEPLETIITDETTEPAEEPGRAKGWFWGTFITGVLGGLLALLTPCVFPMIPLTVSFFLRNAGNRKRAIRDALFYGLTIIFAYVFIGLAISMIFGANALNSLATNPWFNVFFFALLIFFAASFFGAFELTMPSSWSNALDSKADEKGGLIGVILMGLTFVLVSFSCTGPIVGTLLVEAATSGDVLSPAIGMLGFSLALAIPFSLFAVFPTALKSLPKSGGWMNSVKVVLGFIVLAFALKFFSTADAVAQWGILDREVFIVLWIAIFFLLGLYLIGKIKFAHDSELQYLSVPRLLLAIGVFAFVFYLIPGLWGAPLNAVNSFLPSSTTQDFDMTRNTGTGNVAVNPANTLYVGESVKQSVHGLMAFTDYEEGMAAAKKAGKPVFLDFTGLGCVNCKKMEASVWPDPAVLEMLRDDFVKISLYVDDRTPLPESEQFVSSALGRERTIKTIGQKWSVFQAERYGVNTQPYYVLLDHKENQLAPAYGFDTSIPKFIEFLQTGKNNFNQ